MSRARGPDCLLSARSGTGGSRGGGFWIDARNAQLVRSAVQGRAKRNLARFSEDKFRLGRFAVHSLPTSVGRSEEGKFKHA